MVKCQQCSLALTRFGCQLDINLTLTTIWCRASARASALQGLIIGILVYVVTLKLWRAL